MERNTRLEKIGSVAKITFDRPAQKNPLNALFPIEMNEHLDEIEKDNSIKVVLLTGEGDAFSAGGDLKDALSVEEVELMKERNFVRDFLRIPLKMRNMDKPIISVVNGLAVGGGVALALASDIIIASERAKFHMGFVKIGLSAADMGMTYFLPRNVGYAKASELLLFGEVITSEEAERIGMINKVVAHDKLEATAEEWAKRITEGPPIGISLTKHALNKEQGMDLASALEFETYVQSFALKTQDHKEAVRAILEKRKPEFIGK
ncbi:enoyl-CoA hydratase/isomerase family protein [Psychrobacillus sp. NPDC096426]|uniref:enoyl-CoA hydratase/isomerase family protein n=1 Tax=Psychrobacillus sp. NPDC096426 TaxID=3364491 RepID=UPI0038294B51